MKLPVNHFKAALREGRTEDAELLRKARESAEGPAPDLGYPWAAVLPDGRVMVAYYICDATGLRGIEATLFRP